MALLPFLKLTPADQRSKFLKISQNCDDHLEQAFSLIPGDWAVVEALKPANRARNRYSNVFPWDRTRVSLPVHEGASDYINASWVDLGPGRRYIAAQGPLEETMHHFWAMCFHEAEKQESDTIVIAMVTPLVELGREKCVKYWPGRSAPAWNLESLLEKDDIATEGLTVTWEGEEYANDGDFLLTTLKLQSPTTTKTVLHYYYQEWQDAKTPDLVKPLIALSQQIQAIKKEIPLLVPIVHCSAGVGRTGTFIAIDHLLHSPDPFAAADPIYSLVQSMRADRMMMVQTVYQYIFLYEVAQKLLKKRQGRRPSFDDEP